MAFHASTKTSGSVLTTSRELVTSLRVISRRREEFYHSRSCNPTLAFDPTAACTAANAAPPEVHRIWEGGRDFTAETMCFCNLFPRPNLYRISHRRRRSTAAYRRQ